MLKHVFQSNVAIFITNLDFQWYIIESYRKFSPTSGLKEIYRVRDAQDDAKAINYFIFLITSNSNGTLVVSNSTNIETVSISLFHQQKQNFAKCHQTRLVDVRDLKLRTVQISMSQLDVVRRHLGFLLHGLKIVSSFSFSFTPISPMNFLAVRYVVAAECRLKVLLLSSSPIFLKAEATSCDLLTSGL